MLRKHDPILDKVFFENGTLRKMAGAIAGAFLGLLLLLAAAQLYFDLQGFLQPGEGKDGHFLQLNKKVNIFNTLGGAGAFTAEELTEITQQEAVLEVGVFQSNDFKAGAYSDMLGFYTELFFESVPEAFLDVDEPDFRWSEGRREVPVIVARDYLALYNFGFAPSQGLPQISAKTATKFVLDLRLEGNGKRGNFQGRIVGFSDRINTVLVPPAFLEWANREYGGQTTRLPAKLIARVKNPIDPALLAFLEDKGYETGSGRLIGREFMVVFYTVIGVVGVLAVAFLILAAMVFVLGFQLIVSNNAPWIKLLLEQGFSPRTISRRLEGNFLKTLACVVVAVLFCLGLVRWFFVGKMEDQGFDLGISLALPVYMLAILTIALLVWQNVSSIRRAVRRLT